MRVCMGMYMGRKSQHPRVWKMWRAEKPAPPATAPSRSHMLQEVLRHPLVPRFVLWRQRPAAPLAVASLHAWHVVPMQVAQVVGLSEVAVGNLSSFIQIHIISFLSVPHSSYLVSTALYLIPTLLYLTLPTSSITPTSHYLALPHLYLTLPHSTSPLPVSYTHLTLPTKRIV